MCDGFIAPLGTPRERFLRPGRYEIRVPVSITGPYWKVLQFVSACGKGVEVLVGPRNRLKVFTRAHTKDHKIAAVVIDALEVGVGRIIIHRPHHHRTVIVVRVYAVSPHA